MPRYAVNRVAQSNGDHEVHKEGCTYWPTNRDNLGYHVTCHTAVLKAKLSYPTANGCFFCSRECHTT